MSAPIHPTPAVLQGQQPPQQTASCFPQFIQEAFQNIQHFFSKIGLSNFIGFGAIALSALLFEPTTTLMITVLFGICTLINDRRIDIPFVLQNRAEILPEGTIRSRFTQRTIANHNYRPEDLHQEFQEVSLALTTPIPQDHNQTCCAITAALIDFFYSRGFQNLSSIGLDGILARGTQIDALARRQGNLGNGRIDIDEFFQGLGNELQNVDFNPGELPIQAPGFEEMIRELLQRRGNGPIAASMYCNSHFTGLFVSRDQDDQIDQIYVSESRNRFTNGVNYDSGPNRGAILVPLGNTIEQAAARLRQFYGNARAVTLYPIYPL